MLSSWVESFNAFIVMWVMFQITIKCSHLVGIFISIILIMFNVQGLLQGIQCLLSPLGKIFAITPNHFITWQHLVFFFRGIDLCVKSSDHFHNQPIIFYIRWAGTSVFGFRTSSWKAFQGPTMPTSPTSTFSCDIKRAVIRLNDNSRSRSKYAAWCFLNIQLQYNRQMLLWSSYNHDYIIIW